MSFIIEENNMLTINEPKTAEEARQFYKEVSGTCESLAAAPARELYRHPSSTMIRFVFTSREDNVFDIDTIWVKLPCNELYALLYDKLM